MYSYIARQPILDTKQNVIAYELLFRNGDNNCFPNIDPDQATSNILSDNHLTMGIEEITGDLPGYINFHTGTLIQSFPSFLDPKKVVIEILEDVLANDALLATCKLLKEKGYTLALDDHDFDPKWEIFLPYIDIVKVDVLQYSIIEISQLIHRYRKVDIILLAEKVETMQQFERLQMLGFTLFQGYFFAKPEMIKQKKISASKQNILALLSHSSAEKLDFDAMSKIFSIDPGLTYKLLRFINSPMYGRSQNITSLKHALIYIGDLEVKKFIALLALADLSEGKPTEIMRLSLARAKFCELISSKLKDKENPPKAFLTGILSLLDGILDHELSTLLAILPVHEEIKSALIGGKNYLAEYLSIAKNFEMGNWQASHDLAKKLNLEETICHEVHKSAIKWADDILHQVD
ncbi:MAG: c-di-GMP-related signal transduction protein [Alteromonadaceae bacterium]